MKHPFVFFALLFTLPAFAEEPALIGTVEVTPAAQPEARTPVAAAAEPEDAQPAAPAAVRDTRHKIVWRTLDQNDYVGRVRETILGTAYDKNTPIFVEVTICPYWYQPSKWKRDTKPDYREFNFGTSKRYDGNFRDLECRKLATSRNVHARNGKTKQINQELSFTEKDIQDAIKSMRNPSLFLTAGDLAARPVRGEAGYLLNVMVINDQSILPFTRIGMRTAPEVIHEVRYKLPVESVDGLDAEKGYKLLQEAGISLRDWKAGEHFDVSNPTIGWKLEIGK